MQIFICFVSNVSRFVNASSSDITFLDEYLIFFLFIYSNNFVFIIVLFFIRYVFVLFASIVKYTFKNYECFFFGEVYM